MIERLLMGTVGERLAVVIKRACETDWTLETIASAADTTKQQLCRLANNRVRNPRKTTVERICRAIGVHFDEVFHGGDKDVVLFTYQMLAVRKKIAGLVNDALRDGPNDHAEEQLAIAEAEQFKVTLRELAKQGELAILRAMLAVESGKRDLALECFERAAYYFACDGKPEVERRVLCLLMTAHYAEMLEKREAVLAASAGLQKCLEMVDPGAQPELWCETKNGLACVNISLFNLQQCKSDLGCLLEAKVHLEDVLSSNARFARYSIEAIAEMNLAVILMVRQFAKPLEEYAANLRVAKELLSAAVRKFSRTSAPEEWATVRVNLGCAHVELSLIIREDIEALGEITRGLMHLEDALSAPKLDATCLISGIESLLRARKNLETIALSYKEGAVKRADHLCKCFLEEGRKQYGAMMGSKKDATH